jgi:hypothetical protein
MTQYNKHLGSDSIEIHWMKRIVERETHQTSVMGRIVGGYFLLANRVGDSTYFSATKESANERCTLWQAFMNGNILPMRDYIQNREFSEKWANAAF